MYESRVYYYKLSIGQVLVQLVKLFEMITRENTTERLQILVKYGQLFLFLSN